MLHTLDIDHLDERRERRGLPLPHRADDEEESLRAAREGCERFGLFVLLFGTNRFWVVVFCVCFCVFLVVGVVVFLVFFFFFVCFFFFLFFLFKKIFVV